MRVFVTFFGFVGILLGVPAVLHPDEAFDAEKTVVWTPLFQAAWDEMNGALGGPPEESGSELMKHLDEFEWETASVMPEGRWEVWAGLATDAAIAEARKRVREMMGDEVDALPEFEPLQDGILTFGGMLAEVQFEKKLLGSEGHPMDFVDRTGEKHEVEFFGVEQAKAEDFRRHIRVLAWQPHEDFMALELRGKEAATGSVILFQPPKTLTFATACRWIRQWRADWDILAGGDHGKHSDRSLHLRDQVRVPKLQIVSDERLEARLEGSRLYSHRSEPFTIVASWQRIEFGMDERGARVVAATATLGAFGLPPVPATVPRDFSFDEPFFVFLWRDGAAWPYFGAWIGDSSGMKTVD